MENESKDVGSQSLRETDAKGKGNPVLRVRLEPPMWDKLRDASGERVIRGSKPGGMSLFVRRLIYRELRESLPDGNLDDLLDLALRVEDALDEPSLGEHAKALVGMLQELLRTEEDPIRRNFAHQILGELLSALSNQEEKS